jgi:hypothetical protein
MASMYANIVRVSAEKSRTAKIDLRNTWSRIKIVIRRDLTVAKNDGNLFLIFLVLNSNLLPLVGPGKVKRRKWIIFTMHFGR